MLSKLIEVKAGEHGLTPVLVSAIAWVESSFEAYSIRYEPTCKLENNPKHFAKQNGLSVATELMLQHCSFGPMHVLGATARDLGYTGNLLRLTESELGLEYGCKYLATRKRRYPELREHISAYNSGSLFLDDATGKFKNEAYVLKVLKKMRE